MRFRLALVFGAFVVAASIAAPTRGSVVYSSFGPGDSYDATVGWAVFGADSVFGYQLDMGFQFQSGSTAALTRIDAAFRLHDGTGAVDFSLYADDGSGHLGSLIETFSNVGPFDDAPTIVSAFSTLHPILTSGQMYWLVASTVDDGSNISWNFNDLSTTGNALGRRDGAEPRYYSDLDQSVFRVSGQAIPEPASIVLCGLGIVGAAGLARSRRRPAAA
jgi:hypothetical protein